jgi:hypothetical protein
MIPLSDRGEESPEWEGDSRERPLPTFSVTGSLRYVQRRSRDRLFAASFFAA